MQQRSKTVSWGDPAATAAGLAGRSGLEHLEAMRDGRLDPPPIAALMGLDLVTVEPGRVVFGCIPDESVYNPIGVVHGGLVATLLDSACGCAVQSLLPAGMGYTSLELKVSFLRAVHAGDALTAEGRVTKPGRRVSFVSGEVRRADGELVATATSTCLVFPVPGTAPAAGSGESPSPA